MPTIVTRAVHLCHPLFFIVNVWSLHRMLLGKVVKGSSVFLMEQDWCSRHCFFFFFFLMEIILSIVVTRLGMCKSSLHAWLWEAHSEPGLNNWTHLVIFQVYQVQSFSSLLDPLYSVTEGLLEKTPFFFCWALLQPEMLYKESLF